MIKKLTNSNQESFQGERLANVKQMPFKVSIEHSLTNNFCFKDLKQADIKVFHKFIEDTVGKGSTITTVESQFKRDRGPKETIEVSGTDYEFVHLGKDRNPFRVFGYFKGEYFVLCRIDPKHKTHKI